MGAVSMLERFRVAKQPEIEALQMLHATGRMPSPHEGARPSFAGALRARGVAVIAEYKRASPSRGVINEVYGPEDVAAAYAANGAAAISVLTERDHFQGELAYLDRMQGAGLPLLRKDFILHPLQVRQTAATPASALLLIVRMLETAALEEMLGLCAAFGLDAVVEAFDAADVERAQSAGARIIQINNRDLDTLQTDLATAGRLIASKKSNEIWISASGIFRHQELAAMGELGFDAVLVGTSLMSAPHPGRALHALRTGEDV